MGVTAGTELFAVVAVFETCERRIPLSKRVRKFVKRATFWATPDFVKSRGPHFRAELPFPGYNLTPRI